MRCRFTLPLIPSLCLVGLLQCTGACHLIFPFAHDGPGPTGDADAGPGAETGPDGATGCGPFGATCPDLVGLALGDGHSCARDKAGRVWCWGANMLGQLGDGTLVDRSTPAPAAITGVRLVAAGMGHTCAAVAGSGVWCWGDNRAGQAGAETSSDKVLSKPTLARAGEVAQLAMGYQHTCVRAAGKVSCWGAGWRGQLGAGDTNDSAKPRPVKNLSNSTDLCCGDEHCCALVSGAVWCWGANGVKQLGTGDTKMRTVPAQVVGLGHPVVGIACGGEFSCAMLDNGTANCWGDNGVSQLGNGQSSGGSAPVIVKGLSAPTALAPGYGHACATSTTHALHCWGYNRYGQVGRGEAYAASSGAGVVKPGWEVKRIAAGAYHTCAVARGDGSLWCWGHNGSGQVGNGRFARRAKPAAPTALGAASQLAGGGNHSCALLSDGTVRCWGYNSRGQLGDATGKPRDQATPQKVVSLTGVTSIGAGGMHSCAVSGGKVSCWGAGWSGQLGSGASSSSDKPQGVSGLGGAATAVVGGHDHSCALLVDKTVRCWGSNRYGQLGHDSNGTGEFGPVQVKGLSAVTQLSAQGSSTCALRSGGSIWCWGYNASGQLGDGSTTTRRAPVEIKGPINALDVALGGGHACAVDGYGSVWCWGRGSMGQLGDGSLDGPGSLKAQPVGALSVKVKRVTAGWYFSCALDETGTVWCWGDNSGYQLGAGGWSGARATPAAISGVTLESVAAGWSHVCGRLGNGEVRCWGTAFHGQLGDGVKSETWVPWRVMP
jgi:alpha-tubulin suppressor-like RCC1 family protein